MRFSFYLNMTLKIQLWALKNTAGEQNTHPCSSVGLNLCMFLSHWEKTVAILFISRSEN
jgi:hypothetical protein